MTAYDRHSISVIIPVFNGEAFLSEAVESVLKQKFNPLEIIIVDDGSTDRTGEIAGQLGNNVRYFYQQNAGPAAARNRGLKTASGNIIGFLDADDLWSENKLEIQLRFLSQHPALEIITGLKKYMRLAETGGDRHVFKEVDDVRAALNLGCSLFRKTAFEKVGLLDETLRYCEDWDWFMRARELRVPMAMHRDITLYYRRHDDNITNQMEKGNSFTFKMIRKSIERRRLKHDGIVEPLPEIYFLDKESASCKNNQKDEH